MPLLNYNAWNVVLIYAPCGLLRGNKILFKPFHGFKKYEH